MAHAKADRYQRSTEDDTQKKKKLSSAAGLAVASLIYMCFCFIVPRPPRQPKRVLS